MYHNARGSMNTVTKNMVKRLTRRGEGRGRHAPDTSVASLRRLDQPLKDESSPLGSALALMLDLHPPSVRISFGVVGLMDNGTVTGGDARIE